MHLDPNNERTPSNIKRLKLKTFHKRQILRKIKNLFVFKPEKPRKEYSGSGSGSGGNGEIIGDFSYVLKEVVSSIYANQEIISQHFNKQQLPGKLILIHKKYYRICGSS